MINPAGMPSKPQKQSTSSPDAADGSIAVADRQGRSSTATALKDRGVPRRESNKQTQHLPDGTGQFAQAASPLFAEYLQAAAWGSPAAPGEITKDDALLVIDMQRDFVPHHHVDNPQGGRFGVAEGDHIILACVQLIDHFVAKGAFVAATRDYHPHDHVSFLTQGGPFPVHCVQGTAGALLMPEIASALAHAKRVSPERVHVAFKAMHEDVDSFGGLPYYDGGEGRIATQKPGREQHGLGCMMGCSKAPWTGSLLMKQSAILSALEDTSGSTPIDMDCPPDALACVCDDGHDRGLNSLHDALKTAKRVFVCGLALDFCVLDTCLNASSLRFKNVAMVFDAARAAYIPGVGAFGPNGGFLSDPEEVKRKLTDAGVSLCSVEGCTGTAPSAWVEATPLFPSSLGPFALTASCELGVTLDLETMRYTVTSGLNSVILPPDGRSGHCSPKGPLPPGWPGAPADAVSICWANPMDAVQAMKKENHVAFLAVSRMAALQFAAYGGWLLLDKADRVLCVESISPVIGEGDYELPFGEPRTWRHEFTPRLVDEGRFQPVTVPFMLKKGAVKFTWISPGEVLEAGPESWTPSENGAFVYLQRNGEVLTWFAAVVGNYRLTTAKAAVAVDE